jgi:hypothetical protein
MSSEVGFGHQPNRAADFVRESSAHQTVSGTQLIVVLYSPTALLQATALFLAVDSTALARPGRLGGPALFWWLQRVTHPLRQALPNGLDISMSRPILITDKDEITAIRERRRMGSNEPPLHTLRNRRALSEMEPHPHPRVRRVHVLSARTPRTTELKAKLPGRYRDTRTDKQRLVGQ